MKKFMITLIIVLLFVAKVLFFTPIFQERLLFDEFYYVTSARYIMYKLGLTSGFEPPIVTRVRLENNTYIVDVTVNSNVSFINLFTGSYNWFNLEHPVLAKLLIGVLILFYDSLVFIRLALLSVFLFSLALIIYERVKRRIIAPVAGFLTILFMDWVSVHFMYLAVLDTIMLVFLLLSIFMLHRKHYALSIIFLSFACASKEIAIVFTIPYIVYFGATGSKDKAWLSLLLPISFLGGSYAFYLAFIEPGELIASICGLGTIHDPFACNNLCLLGLIEKWGLFTLFTPLIWLWLIGLLVFIVSNRDRNADPEDYFPYFLFLTYFLVVVLLAFKRSIYPYYYAPLTLLVFYPVETIVSFALEKIGPHYFKGFQIIVGAPDA